MSNLVEIGIRHFHMHKQLAMVSVGRRFWIPVVLEYPLDTHTAMVVLEGQGLSLVAHNLELAISDRTIK